MSSPPKDALQVVGEILANVRGVIGDEASHAMFHYAATVEGKRLASIGGDVGAVEALARLDQILGQRSRVMSEGRDGVRVHVLDSPLLHADEPVLRQLLSGLMAGMLSAAGGAELKAVDVRAPEEGFRGALFEFEPRQRKVTA